MALSIYEGKGGNERGLMVLTFVNAGFGALCVFAWAAVSIFLAEPINWAAARHISAMPDLFDFPFIVVWGVPALCAALGWIMLKIDQRRAAVYLLIFPVAYIGLILGCYYLMPLEWR